MKKIGAIGGILVAIVVGCMTIGGVVICGVSDAPQHVEINNNSVDSEKEHVSHSSSSSKSSDIGSKDPKVTNGALRVTVQLWSSGLSNLGAQLE